MYIFWYLLDDVDSENPSYTQDFIPLWLLTWTTDMQDLSERGTDIKWGPTSDSSL